MDPFEGTLKGLMDLESLAAAVPGLIALGALVWLALMWSGFVSGYGRMTDSERRTPRRSMTLAALAVPFVAMVGAHFNATHSCVALGEDYCARWVARNNPSAFAQTVGAGAFVALAMAVGWLWARSGRCADEATTNRRWLDGRIDAIEKRAAELEGSAKALAGRLEDLDEVALIARAIATPSEGESAALGELRGIIARERDLIKYPPEEMAALERKLKEAQAASKQREQ